MGNRKKHKDEISKEAYDRILWVIGNQVIEGYIYG